MYWNIYSTQRVPNLSIYLYSLNSDLNNLYELKMNFF